MKKYFYLLLFVLFGVCSAQENLNVETKYGTVRGHVITLNGGQEVTSFLGIPYAKPPVGNLRFQIPQEPEPWSGVFVASRLGNVCPQTSRLLDRYHPTWTRYAEDCLNVNIFVPRGQETSAPFPVLVHFHGGGHNYGSNILYPFHFYATRGVIVVAANYRLGKLGFVSTGDSVAPGNYGMHDQVQVLRFVQENIGNFGGDVDKVTILGHSAGAASVGFHIISPLSQDLFHQGILASGTDLDWWSSNPVDVASNLTRQVAQQLSCPTASQALVDCLRTKSADALVNATFIRYPGVDTLGFVPTVDGPGGFLPEGPADLRDEGAFAKVKIIYGTGDRETSYRYLTYENGMNSTEFEDLMRPRISYHFLKYGERTVEHVFRAAHFQYTPWPYTEDREANREKIIEFSDDLTYGTTGDIVLKLHAEQGVDTYQYLFGYRSPYTDDEMPPWTGVWHGYDVDYFAGRILLGDNIEVADDMEIIAEVIPQATQEDKDYCNYWMDLFANFIKSGNPTPTPHPTPGNKSTATWPPFRPDQLNYLHVSKETIQVEQNLKQKNHALWTQYVPWIVENTRETSKEDI